MKHIVARPTTLALAACLAAAALPAAAADLRIGFHAEITSADPHVHAVQNRNVWMHVYEPLVRQDLEGEMAYIVWKAEPFIPMATDTFVIRDGKIVVQTYAGYMAL